MFFPILSIVFLTSQVILPTSSQRVQGRYLRPNNPKCDPKEIGCSSADDSSYEAADGYRSIGVGTSSNSNQDFKKEEGSSSRPGRVNFEHQTRGKDIDYAPGVDRNRNPASKPVDDIFTKDERYYPKPVVDPNRHSYKPLTNSGSSGYNPRPDRYVPKPADDEYNFKPGLDSDSDSYKPKPSGIGSGGYNPRPDRYVPRPADDEHNSKLDLDSYKPKPSGIGSGGYNSRPDRYIPRPSDDQYNPKPVGVLKPSLISDSGYNPTPDRYVPRPVDDDYYSKPDIPAGEDSYKPDRPKPGTHPRPVPQKEYPKPDTPFEPHYPNKDLGGYNDPKDDDYNDDPPRKDDLEEKPGGSNCVCVPYYQCRDGHIVTDGAGIIDARKKPEQEEDLPLDGKFKPPSCGPFHVCCNTPETSTVKPYEHRCGVRNPSGINSRILSPSNKGEADFGEWPWQAAVLKSEGKVNIFMCGGVLIDKLHVLTVAHCVFHLYKYDEYPLKVRLGEWDTQTTSEFLAHEDYRVGKIIVHPEYKNTSLWNDVAILRLEEAVLFAPHIDTICLPKYDEIFVQQNCVVTGWGKDAYKGGTFSNIMKEVALQVIDNYQCEEMLRKTRLGRFFQLHDGFLCAGGEYGLDSCKGDGGGPLVCYRKDKSYALAGIVSWGIDCGQPGVPGVYVKIQKYLDWISKTTGVYLEDYWPKHR